MCWRSFQLTVAYEVPEILTPVASALKPFLEGLLFNGLERFVAFAKERYIDVKTA
uniref:Coenzyme Q-binding protein COQ10 START domain-containing protein n=1 Tax=Aegilops tauschii TaxID=37682 RepID=M8ASF4_AEGTA